MVRDLKGEWEMGRGLGEEKRALMSRERGDQLM